MIFLFREPRLVSGQMVIGEKRTWRSLDDDDLYILDVTPICSSDNNTPTGAQSTPIPPKVRRKSKRLLNQFRHICLQKDIPPLKFTSE